MKISSQKAIEYAFDLSYLHTKLFDMEKLPINQLGFLWEIESAIGIEESEINNSTELRKDIIKCYVRLFKMFEESEIMTSTDLEIINLKRELEKTNIILEELVDEIKKLNKNSGEN